jgi:aspartokinase/homoserine dehydrogenase 1
MRAVEVFVAGTGRVGSALLAQLKAGAGRLDERLGLRLTIGGIGRGLVPAALSSRNAHRVFVDCTASAELTSSYEALLKSGVAIVTANKIALSGSLESYHALRAAARNGNGMYTETTVGAGLPVLRPIADLVATGDSIARIEGVLSGTLSFLFSRIMLGVAFSAAVREAYDLGYTEPDPREDLSGRDVARKLLILAREAGFEIEPGTVDVTPVLPEPRWAHMSIEEFWRELPAVDVHFAKQRDAAVQNGGLLSYIGSIDALGARVTMREIDRAHPCGSLSPGDNLIAVTSARYTERPLIIRGPGAGPDVTAAGVFADILRAAMESR